MALFPASDRHVRPFRDGMIPASNDHLQWLHVQCRSWPKHDARILLKSGWWFQTEKITSREMIQLEMLYKDAPQKLAWLAEDILYLHKKTLSFSSQPCLAFGGTCSYTPVTQLLVLLNQGLWLLVNMLAHKTNPRIFGENEGRIEKYCWWNNSG